MIKNLIRLGILITALSMPPYNMIKADNIHLESRINSQVSVNADLEEGEFEYEGSVYKITNEKKHRVELVKSRLLREYDKKCYEHKFI